MNDSKVLFQKASLDPGEVPMPEQGKHPLRFAIRGVTDTVPNLKKMVAGLDIHAGLKAYLADELDLLTTNGAEIHLHDVEHKTGGFNLHLSVLGRAMGAGDASIFKRADAPPVVPVAKVG